MLLLSGEHRIHGLVFVTLLYSQFISVSNSTAALDLFSWYFFWCSVFWRLLIFIAFKSYRLFCLSGTHLHFSEIIFILSFSSHVPKLSRSLCSTHCNFQFSGLISCAPVRSCLNKCFGYIVIGCTVIYNWYAAWDTSSDNTNVLLHWYQRIYDDLHHAFSMH